MVNNNYNLAILFSWQSFKPFLKKMALLNLDTEYFLIHSIIRAIYAIITFKFIDKKQFKSIFQYKNFEVTKITIISIISIIAGYYSYSYLKLYDVGYYKMMKKSGTLFFTVLIGYLFFDEELNNDKKAGLLLIILGIYLIN